jgi:hypothetical protein
MCSLKANVDRAVAFAKYGGAYALSRPTLIEQLLRCSDSERINRSPREGLVFFRTLHI